MLKKTITYVDYDGVKRTEDYYFNLNKAEIIEMQHSVDGGLQKLLEKIVAENDNTRIVEYFKLFISKAYGVKALDGKRFIKTQEHLDAFMQSEAYSELFMELLTNTQAAIDFVNGVMPKVDADADKKGENKPV